jgi:hypothetical protein
MSGSLQSLHTPRQVSKQMPCPARRSLYIVRPNAVTTMSRLNAVARTLSMPRPTARLNAVARTLSMPRLTTRFNAVASTLSRFVTHL